MLALDWRRLASSSPVALGLLLGANAVPLVGVLFLGWDLWTIVRIYWLENGVVGLFAVLRILTAAGTGAVGAAGAPASLRLPSGVARAFLVPFFVFHYGMFWLVHGVFVWAALPFMFGAMAGLPGTSTGALGGPGLEPFLWAGLALLVSHGASFLYNWIGRGEYRTATPEAEMGAPYGRVVLLHLTIIFGAFAVALLGAPVWAMVVMVVVKTLMDLAAHVRDRERATRPATTAAGDVVSPG